MIPVLFKSTATSFSTYGEGALSDAISCEVEEERNGKYELTMEYPISGIHYSEISLRSIIVAKANYIDAAQPFRIYQITKPINGKVTIYARHLSYDLSDIPVQPFTTSGIQSAMNGLISNAMYDMSAWTLTTSRTTASSFKVDVPSSIRSWFGGKEGSLLDVYGGEWHYDGYTCSLENSRGADRGITIRYGVNLTELEQEENCSECYTGVLAYWADQDGNLVQGTIQNVSGTFDYVRILVLDCSETYEEAPTAAQLNAKANSYIANNDVGVPKVNLKLDFAMLSGLQNRVDLCDTVTVIFEKLGVQATSKCIRVRWNTLLDRYEEVELGDAKSELTEAIIKANASAAAAQRTAVENYQSSIEYIDSVKSLLDDDIDDLQTQVDGKVETWFYGYDPTLSNAPASSWDATQKTEHTGDLFFNTSGNTLWRWTGSAWQRIYDQEAIDAAATASEVNYLGYHLVIEVDSVTSTAITYTGKLMKGTQDVTANYDDEDFVWTLETEEGQSIKAIGTECIVPFEDAGYGGTIIFTYDDENTLVTFLTDDSGNVLTTADGTLIYV